MKKIVYDNYRIEIRPSTYGMRPTPNHDRMLALLAEIAAGAKRHLDDVERVTVHWDTRAECSHCGYSWEVLTAEDIERNPEWADQPGDGPGLPVCCTAAQVEWRAEQAAKGGA